MRILRLFVALPLLLAGGAAFFVQPAHGDGPMKITSSAFAPGEEIPVKYTYQGQDISPPLSWTDVPADAQSLVLIVQDPDAPDPAAPQRTWVHWIVYNIPVSTKAFPEGIGSLPPPASEGLNDWNRRGYGGPHPPIGRHRYFFKLFALKKSLSFSKAPTKAELEEEMYPQVISEADLIGTYQLKK